MISENIKWLFLCIGCFCFTGLWRVMTQLGIILRSNIPHPNRDNMTSLYQTCQWCRTFGVIIAIWMGISLYWHTDVTNFFWVPIIVLTLSTMNCASSGVAIIGNRPPSWLTDNQIDMFRGYRDSLLRLTKTQNPDAMKFFEEGEVHEENHKYTEAIESYQLALDQDPNFAKCWISKGLLLCVNGDIETGRLCFEKATIVKPESAVAWLVLARTEKQLGMYSLSKTHMSKAQSALDDERAKEMLDRLDF